MDKVYKPSQIEQRWYQEWEKQEYFKAHGTGEPYCIMIPPPNVTGSLHMGHAFQDTIMDALIRYHRMLGHQTLWQVGTDHAGIATQMVVERQIALDGQSRHDLGREKFIEKIWQWKSHSGNTITQQLRRMGSSLDWTRERFTMDEGLSNAVIEVFVQLFNEGLIYKGQRLVNWDPVLHTAISDLEVVSEEENGHMWFIKYPLSDGTFHLTVATTRPETMLGDTAVAVNPDDDRYRKYIGKHIKLPLTEREIPIIADEYVDPDFGTGCVKITPAHDFNDYEMGKRHNLPLINIFTIDAKIATNAPPAYQGLDRFDARKRIVEDLKSQNFLLKIEDHTLMVPRGDRSHSIVEPYLTDQWFVKIQPLAEPAINAVKSGEIRFVPDNWKNTYFEWMNNIQDWCISRQLWWGHRIPAWYDQNDVLYVGRNEEEIRKQHGLDHEVVLRQEEDVLDTWFSAALWPFSTLGWPEKTQELKTFYPTSVLVTGFDIIFFWVARMIMMGIKFTDNVPFREVYIHGLVRDAHGHKMSKSKGNILDPIDLIDGIDIESLVKKRATGLMQPKMAKSIEETTRKDYANGIPSFGADALRFTFAALASTGRDINFELSRIEGYRNFCNKLWNAARFVLMYTENFECGFNNEESELSITDRWILSRLQQQISRVTQSIEIYRFDLASQAIYDFTWNEYCDWYVEFTKPTLFDETVSPARARGTRNTLLVVLENILRLSHPIIPFITEEIWQKIAPLTGNNGKTIMLQAYPIADDTCISLDSVEEVQWLMDLVAGIRKIRSGMNVEPKNEIQLLLQNGDEKDQLRFSTHEQLISRLAKVKSHSWIDTDAQCAEASSFLVGSMSVHIPMSGLIDKKAELEKQAKILSKLQNELERINKKLANTNFTDRAPQHVVQKEQDRATELKSQIEHTIVQIERFKRM